MNIGEEDEEAIEMPMPLAPGKQNPIHEPSPQVAPVEEPAHARYEASWYGPEDPGRDYEIRRAEYEEAAYALVLVGANSPLCGYCGNNDHTEANCPYKPRR